MDRKRERDREREREKERQMERRQYNFLLKYTPEEIVTNFPGTAYLL